LNQDKHDCACGSKFFDPNATIRGMLCRGQVADAENSSHYKICGKKYNVSAESCSDCGTQFPTGQGAAKEHAIGCAIYNVFLIPDSKNGSSSWVCHTCKDKKSGLIHSCASCKQGNRETHGSSVIHVPDHSIFRNLTMGTGVAESKYTLGRSGVYEPPAEAI
jgi:hypothetical protein